MRPENPKKTKSAPKKRTTFVIVSIIILAGFAAVALSGSSPSESARVTVNGATVRVEIADTPRERSQGLSGRPSLKKGTGMLFLFDDSGMHEFHMKDMRFGIDIIWMNQDREIVDITRSVSPGTYPDTFSPSKPARYVLEVPAGFSQEHAVSIGDTVSFELQ